MKIVGSWFFIVKSGFGYKHNLVLLIIVYSHCFEWISICYEFLWLEYFFFLFPCQKFKLYLILHQEEENELS